MSAAWLKVIMIGALVGFFPLGCDKGEERSSSSTDNKEEEPDDTFTPDCTNLLLQDDDDDPDADPADTVGEEDHDHEEGEDHDHEEGEDHDHEEGEETEGEAEPTLSDCGVSNNNTGEPTGDGGGGNGWSPGPGLEGCAEQGKSWVGVDSTGNGSCGDPLSTFCCTKEELVARFPSVSDKLAVKIDGNVAGGYKLYHCSESGNNYTFHFGQGKGGGSGFSYKYVSFSGTGTDTGNPTDSCPVVTSEDLGITKKPVVDGDDDDDDAPAIPAEVGELKDTSKEGILKFLDEDKKHQAWTKKDATIVTSAITAERPHGDQKVFMNDLLADSVTADDEEHPVGSMAVKELYEGTDLKGYALMFKIKAGASADTWGFYEILGGDDFSDDEPEILKAGATGCAGCHVADTKDFIKSDVPAP
jgi:hypothetical protein